jgi:hypothetical protein
MKPNDYVYIAGRNKIDFASGFLENVHIWALGSPCVQKQTKGSAIEMAVSNNFFKKMTWNVYTYKK